MGLQPNDIEEMGFKFYLGIRRLEERSFPIRANLYLFCHDFLEIEGFFIFILLLVTPTKKLRLPFCAFQEKSLALQD